jgi:hypothetical protein
MAEHILTGPTKLKTVGEQSRRNETAQYYLTVDGEKIRVCRNFFTCTLSETADRLRYHREHKRHEKGGIHEDLRGKQGRCRFISDTDKDYIRLHIQSYPAVESHYCRNRTQRRYLPEGLSVAQMYRQYVVKCKEDSMQPQKEHLYRSIFCADFNYGFHNPKKDQCSLCNQYRLDPKNSVVTAHITRKEQARSMKADDKQNSIDNPEHCVATFDLEKVLCCPSGKIGTIFYKRN